MKENLFEEAHPERDALGKGTAFLKHFALNAADELLFAIDSVQAESPFRRMVVPGGHQMSVAMTSCGLGWVTDESGYRYTSIDPLTEKGWPAIPESMFRVGLAAARAAGYEDFAPDACLINRYEVGARLSLHQDRNKDLQSPVVSVSLGLPATFLFGGLRRTDRTRRFSVTHGDVLVWGGPARLAYHGVLALKDGTHSATGSTRLNITYRKVT